MKHPRSLRSLMIVVALAGVACGDSDDTTTATGGSAVRTVEVTMDDNRFEPATLTAQRGEKVKFVFRNEGVADHDAFVGDAAAQADHETAMRGGEEGGHGDHGGTDGAITVKPGKTGSLTHTFDEAGDIEIGCHQPGHFAGGMKIAVGVS